MKNSIFLLSFGLALMAAGRANANTSNFDFTTATPVGAYYVTSGGMGVYVSPFYAPADSSGGPSTTTDLAGRVTTNPKVSNPNAPLLGEYLGVGLGVCENQNSPNCSQPNQQIDNGDNTQTGQDTCSATCDFEFLLIQFSSAVDLSSIQLGNYGTTGSASDPFLATYWTSSSALGWSSIASALAGTTVGGITNTDGFGPANQVGCTTGVTLLDGAGTSNCAVNGEGFDALSGNGVKFLLIGASILPANSGQDFFTVQDVSFTLPTPEPATFGLIGLALTGLGLIARKRK